LSNRMSNPDEDGPPAERTEPDRIANQVQNITLAALRDMQFDSPPDSAISAPVSSPLHTPLGSAGPRRLNPDSTSDNLTAQPSIVTEGSGTLGTTTDPTTTYYSTDNPVVGSSEANEDMEVTVLDPDHPLMKRFQNALKLQLEKQKNQLELQQRELNADIKRHQAEREGLGVNLYELQQELGRQQANLEDEHDKMAKENQRRRLVESELEESRRIHKARMDQIAAGMKRNQELQTENEAAASKLFAMQHAKEDVRGDIQVMRRAAEKADAELTQAEIDKQRQDMLVHRLEQKADMLRQEISMYRIQKKAQESETIATRDQVGEARAEIESIEIEQKQLYQQWNSSLIGMRRRDEALVSVTEQARKASQNVKELATELDGYKKSILDEEDKNEKQTMLLNRTETDIANTKKIIEQTKLKRQELQQKQASYSRMLAENDAALARTNTEYGVVEAALENFRLILEKEANEKHALQDTLAEELREKMSHDVAVEFSEKLTSRLTTKKRETEMEVARQHNKAALDDQKITEYKAKIWESEEKLKILEAHIEQLTKVINDGENNITRMRAQIERKQTVVDQMNKKLDHLVATCGGEELAPLEMELASLTKSLDQLETEIAEAELYWLKQQHELVKISQQRDKKTKEVKVLTKKVTILQQKKLRVENEIEYDQRELREVERSIGILRNQMDKINILLHRKEATANQLEQDNKLQEVEFVAELRELETEILNKQEQMEDLGMNKKRLQQELIETEKQILLWERKTQLARETIAAVDTEVGQGEIKSMKAEIHRMDLKFKELKKAQERLMREMEYSVVRRETIQTRNISNNTAKAPTKGNFQKKMNDVRRGIRTLKNDVTQVDLEIVAFREKQSSLSTNLQELQLAISQTESNKNELEEQLLRMKSQKQINFQEVVTKQNKSKELQKCIDKKYKPASRDPDHLAAEHAKMEEKLNSLNTVVDTLREQFPANASDLRKANDILNLQHKI